MQCPKCQFENREGARFCGECGHEIELSCPECGTNNRAENKFCDACGYNLRKSEEIPPIDYYRPQSYTPKFLEDKILTTRSSIEGERKLVTVCHGRTDPLINKHDLNFSRVLRCFDGKILHIWRHNSCCFIHSFLIGLGSLISLGWTYLTLPELSRK